MRGDPRERLARSRRHCGASARASATAQLWRECGNNDNSRLTATGLKRSVLPISRPPHLLAPRNAQRVENARLRLRGRATFPMQASVRPTHRTLVMRTCRHQTSRLEIARRHSRSDLARPKAAGRAGARGLVVKDPHQTASQSAPQARLCEVLRALPVRQNDSRIVQHFDDFKATRSFCPRAERGQNADQRAGEAWVIAVSGGGLAVKSAPRRPSCVFVSAHRR